MLFSKNSIKLFNNKGQLLQKFEGMRIKSIAFVNQNYFMFTMEEITTTQPVNLLDIHNNFER